MNDSTLIEQLQLAARRAPARYATLLSTAATAMKDHSDATQRDNMTTHSETQPNREYETLSDALRREYVAGDAVVSLVDEQRQPCSESCTDCGREHLRGEHVALYVPTADLSAGGERVRVVWEGCVDCWVLRTTPRGLLSSVEPPR